MKKKSMWKQGMLLIAMTTVVFGAKGVTTKAAEDTVSVTVTGTYGQTEARSMLTMINDFRTGEDAWCWNSSDTEKVTYTDLEELEYDYNLEQIAMQRAIEIAINFSHVRPNGSICFTAYTGSYNAYGENIAAGQRTAAEAFVSWQETDDTYSGQGHRRNMLSATFGAIGIGHVYHNGIHYWVQEFGNKVYDATPVAANDEETRVAVNVDASKLEDAEIQADTEEVTLAPGETAELPELTTDILLSSAWPSKKSSVGLSCDWTVEDETVAALEDGKVVGVQVGTTNLSATVLGKTITIPVQVKEKVIETEAPETTQPETTQPETTQPETTQPETTQPETTQPETTQPETTQKEEASKAVPSNKVVTSEAVGTKITDGKTGIYKVKQAGASGVATVIYMAPVNKKQTSVTVPDTVTIGGITYKVVAISAKAFYNNKSLKKVSIGKNISNIGKQAFYGCKNLKQITIKTTGLTKKNVGSKAFTGIYKKAKIQVPKSVRASYRKLLLTKGVSAKASI